MRDVLGVRGEVQFAHDVWEEIVLHPAKRVPANTKKATQMGL
jgi:hypothetical protein